MKDYWKTKLTPYDAELFMMVESLTQRPCVPKNGGNHYFFEADYENHIGKPEVLLAIWDAIEGRTGRRLISMNDNADRHAFMVRVRFSTEKYPGIIRSRDREQNLGDGIIFRHKLSETLAVQVERNNPEVLFEFVGNGEMEIPENGPAVFHFLNCAGSVYSHAPEHSYIVYSGPEKFEIVDQETFEKEYEAK